MPRKKKSELVTQNEYARRRGVTGQTVNKAVKTGRIKLTNGKINPETADADWERNTDPTLRRTSGPKPLGEANGSGDYARLRTALTATRLRKENQALEKMLGNTVNVEDARKLMTEFVRVHRDGLLNFPNRYGPQIAAEIGLKKSVAMTAALDKFIRAHLTEMADAQMPALLNG